MEDNRSTQGTSGSSWPQTFDDLWSTYQKPLAYFTSRLLGARPESELVEDAVQDVIVKAVGSKGRFTDGKSLRTWIYSIARNHCLDILRARKRRTIVPFGDGAELAERADGPEAEAIRTDETHEVRTVLSQLDPKDQAIMFLRYFEDMSYAEIASVIGRPEGTIRYRVHEVKARIRADLEARVERRR